MNFTDLIRTAHITQGHPLILVLVIKPKAARLEGVCMRKNESRKVRTSVLTTVSTVSSPHHTAQMWWNPFFESLPDEYYWQVLRKGYLEGYGWQSFYYGESCHGVDTSAAMFMNHGCGGTYNFGQEMPFDETTIDDNVDVDLSELTMMEKPLFNPYLERHYPQTSSCMDNMALHDIEKDGELLDNYLAFGGYDDPEEWEYNVKDTQAMCAGVLGLITQYENEAQQAQSGEEQ